MRDVSESCVRAEDLRAFIDAAMRAAGATEEDAALIAQVCLAADLRGVSSHGAARLERYYFDPLRAGRIDARAREKTLRETSASLALDACNAPGHPVAVRTMRRVIAKASENGAAFATVRNANHFGITAYYPMLALEAGMIGIAMSNTQRFAAPTFGRDLLLGTNPLAYAAPGEKDDAFVLDMATTSVAFGKLEIAQRLHALLKPGWAIDERGAQTLDPLAGMRGALLPLGGLGTENGGHKGYGLGLLVDILCGVLAGGAFGADLPSSHGELPTGFISFFFGALRIDAMRPLADFRRDLSRLLEEMRESEPVPGCERVYAPGDIERITYERRSREGIPLDARVVESLARVAEKAGITELTRL